MSLTRKSRRVASALELAPAASPRTMAEIEPVEAEGRKTALEEANDASPRTMAEIERVEAQTASNKPKTRRMMTTSLSPGRKSRGNERSLEKTRRARSASGKLPSARIIKKPRNIGSIEELNALRTETKVTEKSMNELFAFIKNNARGDCCFEAFAQLFYGEPYFPLTETVEAGADHLRSEVCEFYKNFDATQDYPEGSLDYRIAFFMKFNNDEIGEPNVLHTTAICKKYVYATPDDFTALAKMLGVNVFLLARDPHGEDYYVVYPIINSPGSSNFYIRHVNGNHYEAAIPKSEVAERVETPRSSNRSAKRVETPRTSKGTVKRYQGREKKPDSSPSSELSEIYKKLDNKKLAKAQRTKLEKRAEKLMEISEETSPQESSAEKEASPTMEKKGEMLDELYQKLENKRLGKAKRAEIEREIASLQSRMGM